MQINLQGKSALVTGASRGIGRATALALAEVGADLIVTARSATELEALVEEIKAKGTKAIAIPSDISDFSSLAAIVSRGVAEFGHLDILINNAGITQGTKFTSMDYELWQKIQRINVDAAMKLMQLTLDGMVSQGWGRVVNIASIAAKSGLRYSAAYNASKHALLGLTRSVALDYAAKFVTINAVCPGWVHTEMVEQTIANIVEKTGRSREEAIASLVKDVPLGRMVSSEEVAALVVFLCSHQAAAITGQGLNIDGGTVMS
jgi:NAD(P)-dependent dehydrogenase (short-subunit alcohol dehydrogenase family)